MTDQTTDFFDNIGEGAGAPTALLKGVGDYAHGEIVSMFKKDYVPFGQKDPEKNQDGTTRQQLVIVLQTELRNWQGVNKVPVVDHNDPNSPAKAPGEDDGKRAVYVPERSNIQYAIGRAVGAAKAPFEVGGTLGVKVSNLKDTGKGNPLKEHEAVYKPKADNFFGGTTAPAEAPAQAPATPAPAPAEAPAAAAPAPAAAPQQDPWSGQPAAATSEPPF